MQSSSCTSCLQNPDETCLKSCGFNTAGQNVPGQTGAPTEICRIFPEGTDLANPDNNGQTNSDGTINNNGQENIDDVVAMNNQLVGENGLLAKLSSDNPLQVLSNYQNLGAIWVTDINVGGGVASNQRGSLQLENPVMETVFRGKLTLQDGHLTASSENNNTLNCFTCHNYVPNRTASSNLSHKYGEIIVP